MFASVSCVSPIPNAFCPLLTKVRCEMTPVNTIYKDQDATSLRENVDLSHLQPEPFNGPEVRTAHKAQHREIRAVTNEVLLRLETALKDLESSRQAFVAFKANLSPDVIELRREWHRKFSQAADSRIKEDLRREDPELQDLDSVRSVRRKISDLKRQLAEAESELGQLELEGTPRDQYTKALIRIASEVNGLAKHVTRASLGDFLFNLYKTRDIARLPKPVVDAARVNPDILKFDNFRLHPPLDPLRSQFGDIELSHAHSQTAAAINRLIDLIKQY
jgi:hypothetical protein